LNLPITWPEGKRFAFTLFDDTDFATTENVAPVYSFLADCGFRTTKSAWVVAGDPAAREWGRAGETCDDPDYLRWLLDLQSRGFEIGWHNATWNGLPRPQILAALDRFADLFHGNPATGTNHSYDEAIYWGEARVSSWRRWLYALLTRFRSRGRYRGHIEGDRFFWGDLCRERIKYYRNFVFHDVNTLKTCPFMPYHDPQRPYVNYWFASSNGQRLPQFNRCLREENQDRLEAEGGACIVYTHLACGFAENGKPQPRFRELAERLSKKNGWFVPVRTLLDHLLAVQGHHDLTPSERRRLECKWLWEKLFSGTY
jgi:hypothetical protein